MITIHIKDRLITKLISYFTVVLTIIQQDFLYISRLCMQQTAGDFGITHARKCVFERQVGCRWSKMPGRPLDLLNHLCQRHQKLWKMLHLSIWMKHCCHRHNPVNIAPLLDPWECEFFCFCAS